MMAIHEQQHWMQKFVIQREPWIFLQGIGQRDTVRFPFVPVLAMAAGLEGNSVTENQIQTAP